MTTVAAPPIPPLAGRTPPLEAGDHLDQPTFHARYKQMPPGVKAELVGVIVYLPSPVSNRHAQPHADLLLCLGYYRAFTPGVGTSDNGTTILGQDSEPQPDAFMRVAVGGRTGLDDEG